MAPSCVDLMRVILNGNWWGPISMTVKTRLHCNTSVHVYIHAVTSKVMTHSSHMGICSDSELVQPFEIEHNKVCTLYMHV